MYVTEGCYSATNYHAAYKGSKSREASRTRRTSIFDGSVLTVHEQKEAQYNEVLRRLYAFTYYLQLFLRISRFSMISLGILSPKLSA